MNAVHSTCLLIEIYNSRGFKKERKKERERERERRKREKLFTSPKIDCEKFVMESGSELKEELVRYFFFFLFSFNFFWWEIWERKQGQWEESRQVSEKKKTRPVWRKTCGGNVRQYISKIVKQRRLIFFCCCCWCYCLVIELKSLWRHDCPTPIHQYWCAIYWCPFSHGH